MATDLSAFKAVARGLLDSGTFSDFTVICAGKHYQVHRALLMCHSGYFNTCFQSRFAEAAEGKIELKDPPEAVDMMIHYFYNFDYDIGTVSNTEVLLKHSMVYAVADKYQVADLKELARVKFATSDLVPLFSASGLTHVFESTPDTDYGLRDFCLQTVAVSCQHNKKPAGHNFDDADLKEFVALSQDFMSRWPAALMVELLTFNTFRQAGYFRPERLTDEEKKASDATATWEAIYMYLDKQKDGGRAASLRALNEKRSAMLRK